jgi:dihydrofolate reductase
MTDEVGFAAKMNSMPKYVVSTTLASADWENSTIIRDNVADEVRAIKAKYDGDILLAGSGTLARSLLADGLVDELRLMVFPIVLGSGRRLLAEGTAKTRLKLASSQQVGSDGVTVLTYRPADA